MSSARIPKPVVAFALVGVAIAAGYSLRARWLPLLTAPSSAERGEEMEPPAAAPSKIIVNEQAQANLGLVSKALKPQSFWKTIAVPGMVADRQGISDRNVVAPAAGVVAKILRVPGESLAPGTPLFTLKLLGDSLHQTQAELFKAVQDIKLAEAQRKLLDASSGAVAGTRVIEVDNQIARLEIAVKAYRQELQLRGFSKETLDRVVKGEFVAELTVAAPERSVEIGSKDGAQPTYEMQELKVDLGQQVQSGQTLCLLANHRVLDVEGRAFRDETPFLERSVQERWPVEVDFQEDPASGWGAVNQTFQIRHLANTIDPATRTFSVRIPLENQYRVVKHDGREQTLWRFRPGQRVRLQVRVEELKNVFVLPADAVARDGPESFVFAQNVNTFERIAVRVLVQDRDRAVIANDGTPPPGSFVAQAAAGQLNRMVKAGGASGVPKGYHVHADGSLHKNEDEGK